MLHLLAIARAAGVELSLDDFQAVSDRTPFLADLKPSGRFVMEDVHKARVAWPPPGRSFCKPDKMGACAGMHWCWHF